MRAFGLILLLVGCGGDFSTRPGQALAERVIWREVYGMTHDDPPPVEWVHDDQVGAGAGGVTLIGWKVRVACRFPTTGQGPCDYPDGALDEWKSLPVVATDYAHELMHWRTWLQTGDVDAFHERGDWSLVDKANDAAAAAVWRVETAKPTMAEPPSVR